MNLSVWVEGMCQLNLVHWVPGIILLSVSHFRQKIQYIQKRGSNLIILMSSFTAAVPEIFSFINAFVIQMSSIRFINGVHPSYQQNLIVGKLQLHPILANWKAEGIAVIDQSQLAISDKNSIYLECLNAALTAGEFVSVIDHLQSSHGLCL